MTKETNIELEINEEDLAVLKKAADLKGITVEKFIEQAIEEYCEKYMNDKGITEDDLVPNEVYFDVGTLEDGEQYIDKFEYLGKLKNYKPGDIYDCPYVFYDIEDQSVDMYSASFLNDLRKSPK